MDHDGVAASRWSKLDGKRSGHLNRCRTCSELTIPSLLPPDGSDENTELPTPYQALGARAVNNLAAKLLLALFPPNTSFFRLDIDEYVAEQLKVDMGEEDFKTKVSAKLRSVERIVIKDFESQAHRVKMFRAVRLLITTGNTLLEQLPNGKIKVYRLDKYVVRRNPSGEVVEIIIREDISPEDIPEGVEDQSSHQREGDKDEEREIGLFTRVLFKGERWSVSQEVLGQTVPGSEAEGPIAKCPYIVLTWSLTDGENYGRGHVEENLGDFISYDDLSKALLEGAAAAAKLIFLLKPNGTTNLKDLNEARNGQAIEGNEDDIGVLRLDKFHDFRVAFEKAQDIEARISKAFLLQESVQRQAERVTAEEVRLMAQELEDALGGVYSVLGVELQGPLAALLMSSLSKRKKLPTVPKEIQTTVTTGFEALGRGHDLAKLRELRGEVASFGDPNIVQMYINMSDYFSRVATALGIDADGLIPSQEEIAQLQEQREMMNQMMELMKTGAASQLTKGAVDSMNQGGNTGG